MKIKINYDLMEKIKESKNGVRLDKIVKEEVISFGGSLVILTPLYVIISSKATLLSISSLVLWDALSGGLNYYFAKKRKNEKELSATKDLFYFTNQLSKLELKTTTELLKESEVIKTNYKIHFEDDSKMPKLKQEKYIKIKLCNGYTETLLQEHNVGADDYEISVNEPVKRKAFRLSHATN